MSVYVGIDVHRKRSQVAMVNEGGEVLANRNVPNGVKPVLSVIGGLPAGTPAAYEAAFGWGWLLADADPAADDLGQRGAAGHRHHRRRRLPRGVLLAAVADGAGQPAGAARDNRAARDHQARHAGATPPEPVRRPVTPQRRQLRPIRRLGVEADGEAPAVSVQLPVTPVAFKRRWTARTPRRRSRPSRSGRRRRAGC